MKRRTLVFASLIAATLTVAAVFFATRHSAKTLEFVTVPSSTGSIRTVVNATGTIQPVVTVQVGAQISGQMQEIYADFNTIVKRGQVLAKIDPRNFQAQLTNAEAKVAASRAGVQSSEAQRVTAAADVESAKAGVSEAQAAADNMGTLYKRAQDLLAKGLVSRNDFDLAKTNAETADAKLKQAQAAVQQAQARLAGASAQIQQSRAQLAQAEADMRQAQVNLGFTNIYSPVDGVVISRNVDVGQTIAASLQSPTLFTIANDLTKMQVNASIDEADIGNISSSANVRFTVDAYPGETFRGRIHEIRLNPSTVQNVVTYNAILDIDNAELKLKPGMTANISITVDQRDRVLKIPNAALRYAPPGMTPKPVAASSEPVAETPERGSGRRGGAQETPPSILAPGQKWDPDDKIQLTRPKREVLRSGYIWILNQQAQPEERSVVLGITDGSTTEVVSGALREGEPVVVGDTSETSDQQQRSQNRTVNNPLMPVPRGGGGRRRF